MRYLRIYGAPPFKIVEIHGGRGASGEMAPVARNSILAKIYRGYT